MNTFTKQPLHPSIRKHCKRWQKDCKSRRVRAFALRPSLSNVRCCTHRISAIWRPRHELRRTTIVDILTWMGKRSWGLNLYKEVQGNKKCWVGEIIFPRREHQVAIQYYMFHHVNTHIWVTDYAGYICICIYVYPCKDICKNMSIYTYNIFVNFRESPF